MLLRLSALIALMTLFSAELSAKTAFSINTGSFVYHVLPKNEGSTQYFANQYFSIERKTGAESDYSLLAGTVSKQSE